MTEISFLLPTHTPCLFRLMEDATEPREYTGYHLEKQRDLKNEFMLQSKLPEAVNNFLLNLDNKLDMLLAQLQKSNIYDVFPNQGTITQLGLQQFTLACKEPLAPGDHLELVIIIQKFPFQAISGIGSVSNMITEPTVSLKGFSSYRMQFVVLDEPEKELIVQYMFQEERRQIRKQKTIN